MFVVALLDTVTGAQVPVLGSFAALPAPTGQQEIVEMAPPPATPGTCLTWGRPDASDTTVVDCSRTHLFEQAGTVQLADQKELPDDGRWRQLVRERCDPVVRDYLGGKFDPDGRYRVGALKPSPAKWEQGDRELRCGLQSASRSGALYPMAGTARDRTSRRSTARHLPGDRRPHDRRSRRLRRRARRRGRGGRRPQRQVRRAVPAVDDQDEFLQTECTKIATTYSGGDDVITDKKLTVYWDNLTEDSWKAGTRHVNCNLAALLPDRSGFAPVTGSVRGEVSVGDTPAPPQTNTPEPGVPAEVPPVTPVPSTPSSPTTSADKPDQGTETGSPSRTRRRRRARRSKPDDPAAPSDGGAPEDARAVRPGAARRRRDAARPVLARRGRRLLAAARPTAAHWPSWATTGSR